MEKKEKKMMMMMMMMMRHAYVKKKYGPVSAVGIATHKVSNHNPLL
jgi:hypothetical protein